MQMNLFSQSLDTWIDQEKQVSIIAHILILKSLKVTNKMEEIGDSPKAVTLHLKIPHSDKKG